MGHCPVVRGQAGHRNGDWQLADPQAIETVTGRSLTSRSLKRQTEGHWPEGHRIGDRLVAEQWVKETVTSISLTVGSSKWRPSVCWLVSHGKVDRWVTVWRVIKIVTCGSLTGRQKKEPLFQWLACQWLLVAVGLTCQSATSQSLFCWPAKSLTLQSPFWWSASQQPAGCHFVYPPV